ncbi:MAG TPA: PorP/SprF family type IX secretion system membrane protein [Saprospiraceae bacterium]|nr:PorP/SprF family type IX secretion system membrane protein [Saprospiraceae bacterium]
MKSRIIIFIAFVGCIFTKNYAQDFAIAHKSAAIYNHSHLNPYLTNPAHTGFEERGNILFNYRNLWAGFPGAPNTLTFALNAAPVSNMGLGGILQIDNFGVANRFIGQGNYAYNFRSGANRFSLGLAGKYIQYSLDNEAITDPLHQGPDVLINDALNGESFFAADLGFWAEFSNKYRFGLSLPHLVETRLDGAVPVTDEKRPVAFTAFLGSVWNVESYRMKIEPSIVLRKISDVPFGTDLNMVAKMIDDRLIAGFTYSFGPSWHRILFLGGVRIEKLKFYYSYDQSYYDFQSFNNGSHEVTLSYDLFSKPSPKMKKSEEVPMEKNELIDETKK